MDDGKNHNKTKGFLLFIVVFFSLISKAQPVYPYWDKYNSHFVIYDGGQLKTLETFLPKGFKAGANFCAYITDVLDFKIYANGKSKEISKVIPVSYECTDALIAWNSGTALSVYYNGSIQQICRECSDYTLNDSMMQFNDRYGYFNIYYNGRIRQLEIPGQTGFKLGRNLIAYVDRNNQLKVWHKDTTVVLDYFGNSAQYACGLNTVGFTDHENKLRVFYKDRIFILDKFRPKSFVVGDDMLLWVDQNNNLKLFQKGNIFLIENYQPEVYNIKEGVMYYKGRQNELIVFENGKSRVLENYYPSQIQVRNSTLAYTDFRNRLKAYINGEVVSVSEDIITSFKLYPELIVYYSNAKSLTFWEKGEKFEVQLN